MNKTRKEVQEYFRQIQAEAQEKSIQAAAEGFDWERMFSKLETEFGNGANQVRIDFASNTQQNLVTQKLRKLGFEVDDDYTYRCYVSPKPTLWQRLTTAEAWQYLVTAGLPLTLFGLWAWFRVGGWGAAWFALGMLMLLIGLEMSA